MHHAANHDVHQHERTPELGSDTISLQLNEGVFCRCSLFELQLDFIALLCVQHTDRRVMSLSLACLQVAWDRAQL
jgi:hypothetical protein